MKEEIRYLSRRIHELEKMIALKEKHPNLENSEGFRHVLDYNKKELILLNNILNKITDS